MLMMVWLTHVDTGVYDWMIIYVVNGVSGFRILRDGFSRSGRTWVGSTVGTGASSTVL